MIVILAIACGIFAFATAEIVKAIYGTKVAVAYCLLGIVACAIILAN